MEICQISSSAGLEMGIEFVLFLNRPPGIGKTTSIHCLAHEMLGDSYKEAVLELNASDDRCVLLLHIH